MHSGWPLIIHSNGVLLSSLQSVPTPDSASATHSGHNAPASRGSGMRLLGMSLLVFALHGFHPYSEDGSIYVAGIERRITPTLFRADSLFVDGHTHLSIFSGLAAALVHYLRIPLETLLLLLYLASIVAFLCACEALAVRLFASDRERWGAMLLAGICFTLPAAATSLLIMDPYVTARSFTTPLSLFAVVYLCDRAWLRTALVTSLVIVLHPLMGVYLLAFLALFLLVHNARMKEAVYLCLAGLFLCGTLLYFDRMSLVTVAYRQAMLGRTYLFLINWRWYELAGLLAPLALFGLVVRSTRRGSSIRELSSTCLLLGSTATLASLLFVHPQYPGLLVRLQVLRAFHTIYAIGLILLGGYCGSRFSTRTRWLFVPAALGIAAAMYVGDKSSYPRSGHIDWALPESRDPWEQAFRWIRQNTPTNASFAAAPSVLRDMQTDSTGFRAVAQRDILVDIKDEGIAFIFPASAPQWLERQTAQLQLADLETGRYRDTLRQYDVSWLLLPPDARPPFACPFRNFVVAVCRFTP